MFLLDYYQSQSIGSCLDYANNLYWMDLYDCFWMYYPDDPWSFNQCTLDAEGTYKMREQACTDYVDQLYSYCDNTYADQVQAAENDDHHCFCNCPWAPDDQKQQAGC